MASRVEDDRIAAAVGQVAAHLSMYLARQRVAPGDKLELRYELTVIGDRATPDFVLTSTRNK